MKEKEREIVQRERNRGRFTRERERESEGEMKVYKFVREWKIERKRDREKVCVSVCCGEERLGVNMQ